MPSSSRAVAAPDATTAVRAGVASLAVAAVVRPLVPAGVGPLCPLRRLTGVPCPACGASACVVAVSRADVGAAVVANPLVLGLVVLLVVAAVAPVGRAVLRGGLRRLGERPVGLVPILGVSWLYQLHRYELL